MPDAGNVNAWHQGGLVFVTIPPPYPELSSVTFPANTDCIGSGGSGNPNIDMFSWFIETKVSNLCNLFYFSTSHTVGVHVYRSPVSSST